MRGLSTTFAIILAGAMSVPALAPAATVPAPTGAWRAVNECFMAVFVLDENGRAHTAYLTGEQDDQAAWTWDGTTLKITSKTFDLDTFSGRLSSDEIDADYVWHDLDTNQLNKQACVFERFSSLIR